MVQMTPLLTDNIAANTESDDWLISLQQDLAFPLGGFFFRCQDNPAACGCTSFDSNNGSDCESFVFRLGPISYDFIIDRTTPYLTTLAQIGGLTLLGYVVFRISILVIFARDQRRNRVDSVETRSLVTESAVERH